MPSYKIADSSLIARAAAATTGWTAFTSLQTVFDLARTQGLPVFLLPGSYANGPLTVLSTNGSGKPLVVEAMPGTATISFTGGGTGLRVENMSNVRFRGVTFDGANKPLPDYAYLRPAFIALKNTNSVSFENCQIMNTPGIGVYVTGGNAKIADSYVASHSVGVFSEDAIVYVHRNNVTMISNNGVVIWRNAITGDSSEVIGNTINGVETAAGGTGENGNGVLIFRAIGVTVRDNRIFSCKFSAVRCNGGGGHVIDANYIWNIREVAIYVEAPGPGIDTTGAVISNNHLDTVGTGVSVANAGLYSDGVARSVVIEGNRISNARAQTFSDPGYFPPVSGGNGVTAETDCAISGNIIDGLDGTGIQIGTNDAVRDISVTGNLIRSCKRGIGVSNNAITGSKGEAVVVGNIVRGASGGAIVPVSYDGSTGLSSRIGTADYGNTLSQVVGKVTFAANRSA
jgi:uncharacterized secreted repeat protein (TIGR03808 family)